MGCMTLPTAEATREGVFDEVLEVAIANLHYINPGPDPTELEDLLA